MTNIDIPFHRRTRHFALASAVVAIGLSAASAQAGMVFDLPGDPEVAPFFVSQAFYGAKREGSTGFTFDEGDYKTSNTELLSSSNNQTTELNGATITTHTRGISGGFYLARNSASIEVTNASGVDGYYALGGFGSMTTAQFFSAAALADRAVFRWNVHGVESPTPFGSCIPEEGVFDICATSRIDFAVTTDANPNYYNLVNGPGAMTGFGPGEYSYSIAGMPLNTVITFGLWTSAFVQINQDQLDPGSDHFFYADYQSTFELVGIDLFDANDDLITDWTVVDHLGRTVFSADGRVPVADVPEPTTLGMFALGLLGLGLAGRRRQAVATRNS